MNTDGAAFELHPHHDGSVLHVDPIAPRLGEVVTLRLRVPDRTVVSAVGVRVVIDGEPRHVAARNDGSSGGMSWWSVRVPVANPVIHYRWLAVTLDDVLWITAGGASRLEPRDADDYRIAADADVPAWVDDAVMYQVFPDRFARSSGAERRPTPSWAHRAGWADPVTHAGPDTSAQLYGGDLDGIVERLDHLGALGVTVLYLTPFFPSRSNHRYDASSFDAVDPLLGGDAALERLVTAAHQRGIRVIGDLTTNHSGADHEWFRSAHGRVEADEASFFYWLDEAQIDYVSWLGHKSLPKLNWNAPELRRRFIEGAGSVVAKWLAEPYALDGWRIDVANMTGRHAADDLNRGIRRTIRDTMNAIRPDTLLIAEHTADAADDFDGYGWHGAMTYPSFTRPLWSWLMRPDDRPVYAPEIAPALTPVRTARDFAVTHRRFTAALPWPARSASLNALDSHDTPRFAGYVPLGWVPVSFGISVSLPGIPFIWAGDELGLAARDGEEARTPMPWASISEHADDLRSYQQLIALRRSSTALRTGGMRWLAADDEALAFVRESAEESVLVHASRSAARLRIDPCGIPAPLERLLGDAEWIEDGELVATGPSFTVWRLPGVVAPATDGVGQPADEADADR